MLTQDDIQKLKETLATKEDVEKISTEVISNREEITGLKQDVAGLRETLQSLVVSVDKLAKAIEDFRQEYVAITAKVDAHEKWIKQIAKKVGLKLEY